MEEFDFPKLANYYGKVLTGCLKFGGKDWRWEMYKERLDHIAVLAAKTELTSEDRQYLEVRAAVAATF